MQLIHGDALRVMRTLGDGSCDAIITDPPYASGAATKSGKLLSTAKKYTSYKQNNCPYPDFAGENMDQRSWTHYMRDVLGEAHRICKPGSVCVLTIDWRQLPSLTDAMQQAGWIWRGTVVWDKTNARPQKGRFRQQAEFVVWGSKGPLPVDRPVPVLPGVISAPMEFVGRIHQTQKPLALMRTLVRICLPGGTILDPFAGSGTTLAAARVEGYEAIGIETVPAIYESARQRLAQDLLCSATEPTDARPDGMDATEG